MPFALSHKASKSKLRRGSPTPLDLSKPERFNSIASPTGLPTPPQTADGGFKMFGWKKKASPPAPLPFFPTEAPRPILKTASSSSSGSSIRFAGSNGSNTSLAGQTTTYSAPPQVIITPITPDPQPARIPSPTGPAVRRSSRPTSPSASSFGARIRTSQHSISSTSTITPLTTHQIPASHITTPPTAYVSTMQERAPPPPSPYRPTSERHRTSTSFARPLPELMSMGEEMAVRPPRHSSLFPSESMATITDQNVPMLNIIPATPQDTSEEFTGAWVAPPNPKRKNGLEEAVKLDDLEEVPLNEPQVQVPVPTPATQTAEPENQYSYRIPYPSSMPSIDVELDFSPFQPLADLPSSPSYDFPGTDSLPPSPPFESFPSLPSLASMPSSASDASMPTSSSSSSIESFPDVEEALGSMLASLSDTDIPEIQKMKQEMSANPGLGLGLDIDLVERRSTISSPTAPLSPARRRVAPPPLDLSRTKNAPKPELQTAPPCVNHRVAFYRTAKAAPNSPSSGVFTVDLSHSSHSSLDLGWSGNEYTHCTRDSMSLASESSDDDLHTASIISLTPVIGDRPRMVEVREEVMLPAAGVEVGLAL